MVVSADFQHRYRLKHLEWEEAERPSEVRHPILREVLTHHWEGPPVELASVADAPPGTGLGSSGAYTVCAIKALRAAAGMDTGARELAEAACEIEIGVLERRVGKQDQYAAAFGGVRAYTFHPDDSVEVRALALPDRVKQALRDECLLFFTGRERSASDLLSGQVSGTESGDLSVRNALDRLHELGRQTCAALEAGDLSRFGELMNEQWEAKRNRAPGTVIAEMDALRKRALAAGSARRRVAGRGRGRVRARVHGRSGAHPRLARGRARAAVRHRSARLRGPGHTLSRGCRRGLEWRGGEAAPGTGAGPRPARLGARGERRRARLSAQLPLGHRHRRPAERSRGPARERGPAQRLVGLEPRRRRTSRSGWVSGDLIERGPGHWSLLPPRHRPRRGAAALQRVPPLDRVEPGFPALHGERARGQADRPRRPAPPRPPGEPCGAAPLRGRAAREPAARTRAVRDGQPLLAARPGSTTRSRSATRSPGRRRTRRSPSCQARRLARRRTVREFRKYAAYLAWKLGRRVTYWSPINEPLVVAANGYVNVPGAFAGYFPPGAYSFTGRDPRRHEPRAGERRWPTTRSTASTASARVGPVHNMIAFTPSDPGSARRPARRRPRRLPVQPPLPERGGERPRGPRRGRPDRRRRAPSRAAPARRTTSA